MMNNPEIRDRLMSLANDNGFHPVGIQDIAESGSSRRYYRIITDNKTVIGTFGSDIEENEAFFTFCWHFQKKGFNVPQILCISSDMTCYLQTDLGDTNLFSCMQKALATNEFDDTIAGYYRQALEHLVEFQIIGNEGLDYSKAYPASCFDKNAIIADLNYFRYYFVKPHLEIVFNEARLDKDFERLSDFLASAPNDFFMYRDFQSRNIMIKNEKTYFLDFQGGRKGPLQYDVVSLLYQAKAQIPQAMRNELKEHYKSVLARHIDPNEVQFDNYYPFFIYLRLMQVLGAYGFRGLIQRKSHFLESIPYALNEIEQMSETHPLNDYPELYRVIAQMGKLRERYVHNIKPAGKLTVTINSFSYKKGYPDDFSGNGGGFVFDCRALPNPGREERFKVKTGRDWEVADFMMEKPQTHVFIEHYQALVAQIVDNFIERHFSNVMISFGCTGGQHRSVFFAQSTYDWLKQRYNGISIDLHHLGLNIHDHYES